MVVLRSERTDVNQRRVTFEMVTDTKPTEQDIAAEQIKLGYHPNGYGGPINVVSVRRDDTWATTWQCFGSCD